MDNYFNGRGTFGFTCDVCGREVNGCSIVNGMKFCAKCYQETFGKDNQQNEIQQLKQQLEEKDKEIEKLKQQNTLLENENGKLAKELIVKNYKKAQKEVSFGIQLAIQELEKVKEEMDLNGNSYCEIRQGTSPHNPTDYAWFNYVKFRNYLNQQIKELKGEKDDRT